MTPMANTTIPAQWWLYSDQAISAGESGWMDCPGTNDPGWPEFTETLTLEAILSSLIAVVTMPGHFGAIRVTISGQCARSTYTSAAGDVEVSGAAITRMVKPIPTSASAKRRRGSSAG